MLQLTITTSHSSDTPSSLNFDDLARLIQVLLLLPFMSPYLLLFALAELARRLFCEAVSNTAEAVLSCSCRPCIQSSPRLQPSYLPCSWA